MNKRQHHLLSMIVNRWLHFNDGRNHRTLSDWARPYQPFTFFIEAVAVVLVIFHWFMFLFDLCSKSHKCLVLVPVSVLRSM